MVADGFAYSRDRKIVKADFRSLERQGEKRIGRWISAIWTKDTKTEKKRCIITSITKSA